MSSRGEPSLSSLEYYLSPRATVGVESQSQDTQNLSLDSGPGGANWAFGFNAPLLRSSVSLYSAPREQAQYSGEPTTGWATEFMSSEGPPSFGRADMRLGPDTDGA